MKPYKVSDHFHEDGNFLSKLETLEILETIDDDIDGECFSFLAVNKANNIIKESIGYFSLVLKEKITHTSLPNVIIQKDKKYIKLPKGESKYICYIFLKTNTNSHDIDTFDEIYGGDINFITHRIKYKQTAGSILIFKNIPNNIHMFEEVRHGSAVYITSGIS